MADYAGLLSRVASSLLDLVFPIHCAGCGAPRPFPDDGFWCDRCLNGLPWIRHPLCPTCGRPFPNSPSASDHTCGDCLVSGFSFDFARSATLHEGPARDLIHRLKFGGRFETIPPLARLLERSFREESQDGFDFICPVPLHLKRLKQRGFNQSGLLSKALGKRIGIPVKYYVLFRPHWTEPQTRLTRDERLRNVKGAFRVNDPAEVKKRKVLLIDDVFTTGTTLSECARALKRAGALEVHALTVSRALPEWRPPDDL